MSHPYHHALSSARKYGGQPEDYLEIHRWFDATKSHLGDFRHRALRHHTLGIFELEQVFGTTITNSAGRQIPTRFIGEQHVREDCLGMIPTPADWLSGIPQQPWMHKPGRLAGGLTADTIDSAPAPELCQLDAQERTLDTAIEAFKEDPSPPAAAELLRQGLEYWRDGLIGDDTFELSVLSRVLAFLDNVQSTAKED